MLLASVLLYLIPCVIGQSLEQTTNKIAKCCGESYEARVEDNSTLTCSVESPKSRLQVLSNTRNFLENNTFGECIDVEEGNFYRYTINNSTLESKTPLSDRVFVKCCPMKHVYDNKTRSCRSDQNVTETYIHTQFVKIGLPHCEVITDSTFITYDDALYYVKLGQGDYCIDRDLVNNYVVRECKGMQICEKKRCFRKCCPDGQSYINGAFCQDTYVHGFQLKDTKYSNFIDDIDGK